MRFKSLISIYCLVQQITVIIVRTALFTFDQFLLKMEGERGNLGLGESVYLCESVGTVLTRVNCVSI